MNVMIRYSFVFLWLLLFSNVVFPNDISPFLNNIENRFKECVNTRPYKVKVKSVQRELDRNQQSKKITTTYKIITRIDSVETIKIINSTIEEKGKIKNNTSKAIEELNNNNGRNKKLNREALFPFFSQNQENYQFQVKTDSLFNGSPATVLECSAKEKKENLYNGNYYFDPENFTLFGFKAKPSQNPQKVKDMLIKMSFYINENGKFNIKSFEMNVDAKVFLNNLKMQVLETYDNYEYLD